MSRIEGQTESRGMRHLKCRAATQGYLTNAGELTLDQQSCWLAAMFMQKVFWSLCEVLWVGAVVVLQPAPFATADDAKPVISKPELRTVLVLGDSLASGYGLEPEEAFPALLQKKVESAKLNYKVINAGVSGDTTAGGLRRIDWLLRQRVDVLVLELGGNDGLRGISPGETKTNLQGIIDRAKKKFPDVRIVIAGMQMPPNMGADYTSQFKEIFPELAKQNSAALVPFLLEGVGGKAELNLPDRIHPTAEGQKIVAENVWRVLEPVLRAGH